MWRRSTMTGLALLALLAGCGGTDLEFERGGGSIESVSGGYAEAAEAICDEVARRFEDVQREPPRTFEQGERVTGVLVEVAGEGEDALADLDPPAEDARAFARYLAARGEATALLEEALEAASASDGEAYEEARAELADGAGERGRLARSAELEGCARAEGS